MKEKLTHLSAIVANNPACVWHAQQTNLNNYLSIPHRMLLMRNNPRCLHWQNLIWKNNPPQDQLEHRRLSQL